MRQRKLLGKKRCCKEERKNREREKERQREKERERERKRKREREKMQEDKDRHNKKRRKPSTWHGIARSRGLAPLHVDSTAQQSLRHV
jgi:hypothetical protein